MSIQAVNGTVTKRVHGKTYTAPILAHGAKVLLTATANPGYHFTGWSGDIDSSSPIITVTMDGNKTVTANFVESQR